MTDKKIFLCEEIDKPTDDKFIAEMTFKPIVELTPSELELLKISIECLLNHVNPNQDNSDKIALLKKLESL